MHLSILKTGIVLGLVIGLMHACWAALVAFGLAQPLIKFILDIHFIALDLPIAPFNIETAALLVGVTAAIGFVVGAIFALAWNLLHPKPASPTA